jgi:hypothetical protein
MRPAAPCSFSFVPFVCAADDDSVRKPCGSRTHGVVRPVDPQPVGPDEGAVSLGFCGFIVSTVGGGQA